MLVGIDTLRADHLGCHGYARPTSPRIDRLASEGRSFQAAISPSPWTLPAFASIMTGLLPSRHRAGEGSGFRRSQLSDGTETLATHLRRAGWATGSFVSNGFAGAEVGLAQGMDEHRRAAGIARVAVDDALAWLDRHARDRFFLFLHIVDPHEPYAPSPADAEPFIDPDYEGPIGLRYSGNGRDVETAADRRRVVDLYDGEVRYADRLVGEVLDALAARGIYERTMVIVTSDHGEELFERGALGHGHTLHDELLRVPLVVRLPGEHPAGAVAQQVSTVDIMPTVLDAVGLPVPDGLDGESLLPLVRDPDAVHAVRPAFAEFLWGGPEQKAIRSEAEKLILTPSDGSARLYALAFDPGERVDVSAALGSRVETLSAQLEARLLVPPLTWHAIVRGGRPGDVVEIDLRVERGRFHDARLVDAGPDDRLTMSPGGDLVAVRFVRGDEARVRVGRVQVATTEVAPVTMRAYVGGLPIPPEQMLIGDAIVPPPSGADPIVLLPVAAGGPTTPPTPPDLLSDDGLRLAIQLVRDEPSTAALAEDTKANLRALGYVE